MSVLRTLGVPIRFSSSLISQHCKIEALSEFRTAPGIGKKIRPSAGWTSSERIIMYTYKAQKQTSHDRCAMILHRLRITKQTNLNANK